MGNNIQLNRWALSYRCDAAICKFKFAVLEFDTLSRDDQFPFWKAVLNGLPVVALIDSNNKNLHCRIHVPNEWKMKIEQTFFEQYLKSLGIGTACKKPARMNRLTGCIRKETGQWQQLLYLNQYAGMEKDLF